MEPFSNHLQIKSCPAERQIAWCIGLVHKALTGVLDVLFCVEIIEFQFPFLTASQWPIFWKTACAETSEVVPKLNPNPVCLPCSYVLLCLG